MYDSRVNPPDVSVGETGLGVRINKGAYSSYDAGRSYTITVRARAGCNMSFDQSVIFTISFVGDKSLLDSEILSTSPVYHEPLPGTETGSYTNHTFYV